MKTEKRAEMRKMVDNPGSDWKRYGSVIDEEPSVLYWHGDRELQICYEDMDGNAKTCRARYNHPEFGGVPYFVATDGQAKGNRMMNVFAYKELD